MKRDSHFTLCFAAILGISIIFSIFVGCSVLFTIVTYRREMLQNERNNINYYQTILGKHLDNIADELRYTSQTVFYDESILKDLNAYNDQKSIEITRDLTAQFSNSIQWAHQIYKDIDIVRLYSADGKLVSSVCYNNAAVHGDQSNIIGEERKRLDQIGYGHISCGTTKISNAYYLYAVRELRSFDKPNITSGYIICECNIENISKFISPSLDKSICELLITDKSHSILYATNKKWIGENEADYLKQMNVPLTTNDSTSIINEMVQFKKYFVTTYKTNAEGWHITCLQDMNDAYSSVNNMIITFISAFSISLLMAISFSRMYFKKITNPLVKLARHMITYNDMSHPYFFNDEEDIRIQEIALLISSYNHMLQNIENLLEKQYKSKIRERDYQLAIWRVKIRPHFLYNTLSTIQSSAITHQDRKTAGMISLLSDYFRECMCTDDIVLLDNEFHYVHLYTDIMKYQHENVEVHISIDDNIRYSEFPNFVLQPLVENGYKHGLKPLNYRGTICVSGHEIDEHHYSVTVFNSGVSPSDQQLKLMQSKINEICKRDYNKGTNHIGLISSCERLIDFFGDNVAIRLEVPAEGGMLIRIDVHESN